MILSVCPNPSIDTYAWLTRFSSGQVNRIEKIQKFPGGKATHVALALAELGAETKLMGNWAGFSGEWIKNAVTKKNIACSGVQLEGNNRTCYTFRSTDSDFNHSELLEPGPEMTGENWNEFKSVFTEEITHASLVCMSGSWPTGAPTDAYRQLIEIANQQDCKVILDCSGTQLEEALKSEIFGLHINEHEAKALCGSADIDVLNKHLNGKVNLIALTKGKEGMQLILNNQVIHANVKPEKVISSVGSGDCLTAGIAYAVSNNLSTEQVAAYGVACGAANCMLEALGMLEKQTVEKLMAQVEIKKYKI